MKKIINYCAILLLMQGLYGCKTPKATKLMTANLRIIEKRVNHDPSLNLNDVEPAINFLEKTTGIRSQSSGNFMGRFQPTKDDYLRWSNWFRENKSKIYFDEINNKIRLNKDKQ